MEASYSQKFLKKRKFYMVLPLIVFPFVTIVFWLLGGGSHTGKETSPNNGLNTVLPDAKIDEASPMDKLSFYAMAERDSVSKANQHPLDLSNEQPEEKPISVEQQWTNEKTDHRNWKKESTPVAPTEEIDRLQEMVQTISARKPDPELEALNQTLDKLVAIQGKPSGSHEAGPEAGRKKMGIIRVVESVSEPSTGGFFGVDADNDDTTNSSVILASVHGEQVLTAGSVIKLRLLQPIRIGTETIPGGSFVYGEVSLNSERMKIHVQSIQFQQQLYPVAISVFDLDGIEGIHVPGSVYRDEIKSSASEGIQSINGLSLDPSFKGQLAGAGLNAAKKLLGQKMKMLRVTVKAGYQVLLKNENANAW